MASLCCLVAAALALGSLLSRLVSVGVSQACALILPLACALVLLLGPWGMAWQGGCLALGLCLWLGLLSGVGRPDPLARDVPRLRASGLLVLLFLLLCQLHYQALSLDGLAWKRHAVAAALALGSNPDGLLLSGVATTVSPQAHLLGQLLPRGWDPLTLEWVLAPVLLLASAVLLASLLERPQRQVGEIALALLWSFLLPTGTEELALVATWSGSTPLAFCLLLGALGIAQRLIRAPQRPGLSLGLAGGLSWCLLVWALAAVNPDLAWLLLLLLGLGAPWLAGDPTARPSNSVLVARTLLLLLPLALALASQVAEWRTPDGALGLWHPLLWVAPLALWTLWRSQDREALLIGLLGALAVGAPGLASAEPFLRSEVALVGLTSASVLALAGSVRGARWRSRWALGLLVLLAGLFVVGRSLAPGLTTVARGGGWPLMAPPGLWRTQRVEMGVTTSDLDCARVLASQALPNERLLTNLGESGLGMGPDAVLSALSGVALAGWTCTDDPLRPTQPRPDGLMKALQASGRPDLLWNSGVSWLLLRPGEGELGGKLGRSGQARRVLVVGQGEARRELWRIDPSPSLALDRLPAKPPFRSRTVLLRQGKEHLLTRPLEGEFSPEQTLRLRLSAYNEQKAPARLGWVRVEVLDREQRAVWRPLHYMLGANPLPPNTGDQQELVVIAPGEPGDYQVRGRWITASGAGESLFEFPLRVGSGRDGQGQVESQGAPSRENL